MAKTKEDKVYTTNRVISASGKIWRPGEPITSPAALARIDKQYVVELKVQGDQAKADGQPWYDERTVRSVLDGVDGDPQRAAYALKRENARDEDRQRGGVLGPLTAILGDNAETE